MSNCDFCWQKQDATHANLIRPRKNILASFEEVQKLMMEGLLKGHYIWTRWRSFSILKFIPSNSISYIVHMYFAIQCIDSLSALGITLAKHLKFVSYVKIVMRGLNYWVTSCQSLSLLDIHTSIRWTWLMVLWLCLI